MSDINLQIAIKEENAHLFKRCIRKLLEFTFILKEKDERLYQFASRESNRQDISEYLQAMGFDLIVEENTGICMLSPSEQDADTAGLKRANLVTFSGLQRHLLLILWAVYLERLGYNEGNFVTKGELIDKIQANGITLTKTELNAALRLFRKHSLINYSDNDSGEDGMIHLYPSLQFGWDLSQFRTVVAEEMREDTEEMNALDDFEEDDDG